MLMTLPEMWDFLSLYLQYSFVQRAMIVTVLVALCSALLGVTLVLRRFSFIGDGLSHVAFGAMAVAAVLNLASELPLVLAVTVICAVLLLRTGQNAKIMGDAAMAMVSVGALAIGYLLMNIFSSSTNLAGDVCTTLFGSTSILTLTEWEVWLCVGLAVAVTLLFVLFYHQIFAVTFDENFAAATGVRTGMVNLLLAVVTAVVIVLAMNLVGSLLISALVIFPAVSAMRVYRSFRAVTLCAAVLSVVCAFLGLILSILFGTPVGSTIVAVDLAAFGLFSLQAASGGLSPWPGYRGSAADCPAAHRLCPGRAALRQSARASRPEFLPVRTGSGGTFFPAGEPVRSLLRYRDCGGGSHRHEQYHGLCGGLQYDGGAGEL